MLIEFNVTNYRSLHDKQTLSMVAAKDEALQGSNCIESGLTAIPQLLRSAVLYGSNASGKSNLIIALGFMRSMIETSATTVLEGQALNVTPFRFDPDSSLKPSEFEITFIDNGVRYQYGFTLNSTRVLSEWLFVYIGKKHQRWFERTYDESEGKDQWYFGSFLQGGKQRTLWSESTRANALFLSTAVNLNSEQLRPIFNWFVNKLVILTGNSQFNVFYTMNRIKNGLDKEEIIRFLQSADLGITDIEVKTEKGHQAQILIEPGTAPVAISKETDVLNATFFHQGKNQDAIGLNLSEESQGTQKFFAYAAPILDILREEKLLVIDELDTHFHPKMVRFLVDTIQKNNSSGNKSQLIFTTHNTSFLDTELFRRDQIWFMEKDRDQASHLYPLTDFSPRKEEALERVYLVGRYGALPFLDDFNL